MRRRKRILIGAAVAIIMAAEPAPAHRPAPRVAVPAGATWIVVTTPGSGPVITLDLPAEQWPELYRLAEPIHRPGLDHRATRADLEH